MTGTLVIYYSFTGNSKKVAEYVKDKLNADILELEPEIPFFDDYDTVVEEWQNNNIKRDVEIKEVNIDLANYKKIVLITCTWWYGISPVMKKFLKGLYIAVILLFLYLPIGVLMVLSFNESKSMSIWTGFSTRWYEEMFSNEMILDAVWNTFTIAICAAAASTVIGVLACLGISRMRSRSQKVIMAFNNIPLLNADIVTGISLMMTFLVFGISLSWGTVLLSHITFCIPYVILSVMPKIKQLSPNMYEAALDLGATPAYAFRKVILPDLMPGITSGFLLAFTMSVDDFVVTHFTRGAGINTISTLIYSQVKVGIRPTLFALSTVIFVVVLVVLVISNVVQNRKGARN